MPMWEQIYRGDFDFDFGEHLENVEVRVQVNDFNHFLVERVNEAGEWVEIQHPDLRRAALEEALTLALGRRSQAVCHIDMPEDTPVYTLWAQIARGLNSSTRVVVNLSGSNYRPFDFSLLGSYAARNGHANLLDKLAFVCVSKPFFVEMVKAWIRGGIEEVLNQRTGR